MTGSRYVSTHVFSPDPTSAPDHRGDVPCTCGLPKANRIHQLPDVDPATMQAELRRLGERGGGEQ